jgi:tetratricopeptide (TPR) repeat protein
LAAAQQNDAVAVYNAQSRAVQLNPYLDEIRRGYASTNIAIASALAQKSDITEQETQQFSQLIQQAIRESQAATLLDPTDTNNWTLLSQIYRSLIGSADAADQWTVSSYVNAIQTDPQNPILRVELGGVLFGTQNYDQAAQFFQQAIESKPDYANAYYNLANTLVKLNRLPEAKSVYQNTLQLIEADSENYVMAAKELEQVDALLEQQAEATKSAGLNSQTQSSTQPSSDPLAATPNSVVDSPLETVNQPSTQPLDL